MRGLLACLLALLLVGCQAMPAADQFSVVKGYPGNTYGRDERPICETDCLVWSDDETECWQLVVRRAFVEFEIPELHRPVKHLVLTYEIVETDNPDHLVIAPVSSQPSAADWNMAWGDLYNGLGYDGHSGDQTRYYGFLDKTKQSVELNQNALDDFNAAVAAGQTWFGMGFRHQSDLEMPARTTLLGSLQLNVIFQEKLPEGLDNLGSRAILQEN